MTGKPPDTSELLRRIEALERQAKILPSSFSSGQEDLLHGVLNDRLKSQQHESRDHLNRGLSPLKITPGTNGQVLTTTTAANQVDATWAAPIGATQGWTVIEQQSTRYGNIGPIHTIMNGGKATGFGGDIYAADTSMKPVYYLDQSEYAAPNGRSLEFRVRTYVACNGTGAASAVFQSGVWGIAFFGGAAGVLTLAGDGTGYRISAYFNGQLFANNGHRFVSAATPGSSLPSAMHYTLGFTNHTTLGANTYIIATTTFEYRHV